MSNKRLERYRVVYGETMPAWEKRFTNWTQASAFIRRCLGVGDTVFRVEQHPFSNYYAVLAHLQDKKK